MDIPRAGVKELTDTANRDIVAQNTPRLWAAYRRSMDRAAYFYALGYKRQKHKMDALEASMFQTASMGGKGLEAIRDAAIGAKLPTTAVGMQPQQPRTTDGVPHL